MKMRVYIDGLFEANTSPELLSELARIYPEGREPHGFTAMLPGHDDRVRQIITVLDRNGRSPCPRLQRWDRSRQYMMVLHRDYDAADLAAAEYLELKPAEYLYARDVFGKTPHGYTGAYRDQTGKTEQLHLERRFLRRGIDFASGEQLGNWVLIPNRVKQLLENSRLRHVTFRPTVLLRRDGEPVPWGHPEEPWWELTSDLVLPPLSPTMDLRDKDGKPIKPGDLSNGCIRIESLYVHPELRYRAADLKKTGPFDLAHTYESFWSWHDPLNRKLVASQRFYRFCVEHKFKVDWVPVRIDP